MKLSFEKIRSLLHEAIQPTHSGAVDTSCWINEVYEDEVVYRKNGKLYNAPYKIGDGNAEIGTAVEVREEIEHVRVFSADRLFVALKESKPDGSVVRTGKLFEAGDFSDKDVRFDADDLEHAVKTFRPVENDLEHASTILDGHLGKLQKVWRQGSELFGEVEVPAWLDKVIGDAPIKVSLAFDNAKRIVGNALVLRPRIADAAIMSAFSASGTSTDTGQRPKTPKQMKLKDAIRHFFGLDRFDDLDAEVTLREGMPTPASSDVATHVAPAPTTPEQMQPSPPSPPTPPVPAFSVEQDARFKALEGQLVKERAYAYADTVIRDKKALPSQRDQVAVMYAQSVTADADGGPLFSADAGVKEGKNVETLKSFFAAAPAHVFVGEALVGDAGVLNFGGHGGGMDKDKTDRLLAMSALGRKAMEGTSKN